MGREGRQFVGWLGLAMVLLGATGLVLWWPKKGQWKYAFIVRRTARGLRFHRELHAMLGIWAFFVFIVVTFSGVVLAWPQTMGTQPPGFNPRALPALEPIEGAHRIGADQAVAIALAADPDATLRSITIPGRRDQPVTVNLLSHGAINATALIDPWRAKLVTLRDPSQSFLAWQRPVHQGTLGPVWKFLVFLSGFLPAIFVTTGVIMWAKKRKAHIAGQRPARRRSRAMNALRCAQPPSTRQRSAAGAAAASAPVRSSPGASASSARRSPLPPMSRRLRRCCWACHAAERHAAPPADDGGDRGKARQAPEKLDITMPKFTPPPAITAPAPVFDIAPSPNAISAPPPRIAAPVATPSADAVAASTGEGKASYLGELLAQLNRFKQYPPQARAAHIEGVVMLHFVLDRSGRLLSAEISQSSGRPALDREALALIVRAQPLPPMPAEMGPTLDAVLPINFSLRS